MVLNTFSIVSFGCYQLLEVDFKWKLWVQFSPDGVAREVLQMRHPDMDPPGNSGGKD